MNPAHLQALIENYGYIVAFLGTLIEGETVLIMAGFAAHRGYLNLGLLIGVAAFGGFLGDQFFFTLGRWRGRQLVARFPTIEAQSTRVQRLLERHATWFIIGVRFMYGLRVAGPVLLGLSSISHARFAIFNLIGALIWAALIAGAGYLFGEAVERVLDDLRHYEVYVLAAMLVIGIFAWSIRAMRRRRAVREKR